MTIEERYELSCYQELTKLNDAKNIWLVRHNETGMIYIKKEMQWYNEEVYLRLKAANVPNIPKIYLCVRDDSTLTVIEEYIHGVSLDKLLEQQGILPEARVIEIAVAICNILEQLHAGQPPIVHRDIKPGNIMISEQGVVKVMDFGIARALATNPKVLLCDEATSALDPKTTRQILELIGDINKKLGITVVIITHQMSVVKEVCNHVAILDDGEVVEEGLVSTVFSAPKSAAARHLVFPRGADIDVSDPQQQRRIRLIFRSAKTTSIPLVAQLATEEGISATVISANTQKLSEEVYGSMLLGVPNAQFEQAMDFLRGIENLQVEEASVDVQ